MEKYSMPYTDEFLVNRLLSHMDGTNKKTKKFTIVKPVITRKDKKTLITNFGAVCNSLNRDIEILRDYFEKSLALPAGDVTVNASSVLIITGSHSDVNLIKHLQDYVMTYVICTEKGCGSGDTELVKENRILWMLCKKCNCKKAIVK